MRATFILFLLVFSFTRCTLGQVPENVKKTFAEKFPSANNVNWSVDRNGYWEGSFNLDGKKVRSDFTAEGKWVETEMSIQYEELPPAIQATIERDFDKKKIREIEKVANSGKGDFYDVEFKQDGKIVDVEFKEDGTVQDKNSH